MKGRNTAKRKDLFYKLPKLRVSVSKATRNKKEGKGKGETVLKMLS